MTPEKTTKKNEFEIANLAFEFVSNLILCEFVAFPWSNDTNNIVSTLFHSLNSTQVPIKAPHHHV